MKNFINKHRGSGFNQSLISVFGNFFATGLSAIALILISRLLGPEKFGLFSVGFSIVLILTRINEAGLNLAIVKLGSSEVENKNKNKIYSITLKYKILISGIIFSIGIISSELIAKKLNFPNPEIIKIAFTVGLITTYYEHLLFILQSIHYFTNSVLINTMQAGTKLIGTSILFFLNIKSVWPIFLTYVVSTITPILVSKKLLPKWIKINPSIKDNKIKKKILTIAKHSSVALISAGIIENIDVLFLQKNLTAYETGLYGGVSRIAMMFALIAYSLGNVLNARVAKYKSREHLSKYIKKSFLVLIITILGFLIFIPFAKLLILLTIGSEYLPGVSILIILTASSFLAIASIPFLALFFSYDADWYFSLSGILQLIIVLAGNTIFVPLYGLEAAAWTKLAARGFLFIFTLLLSIYLYYKNYVRKN